MSNPVHTTNSNLVEMVDCFWDPKPLIQELEESKQRCEQSLSKMQQNHSDSTALPKSHYSKAYRSLTDQPKKPLVFSPKEHKNLQIEQARREFDRCVLGKKTATYPSNLEKTQIVFLNTLLILLGSI